MDRGCGYGGRCSPSVRSSENRKGSDPGISDGANTALEFAADHPERAEKIIAVSANALPDGLIPPMLFMENTRFQCAKILENIKPVGKFGKWCKREQFLSSLILHSPFSQKRD